MHEHTPSEEAPEPTEESEPTDPTGIILLHVFLVGLVLVIAGALAHSFSQPAYGASIDLNPVGFVLVWVSFAVYVAISTLGTLRNWKETGIVLAYHVGAFVLAVPGGIALLVLWVWLGNLVHS